MTTYDPGMGGIIINGAQAITERLAFAQGFMSGCGEAAVAVIIDAMKGDIITSGDIADIIRRAIAAQEVGAGGVSQPHGLEQIASGYGVSLTSGDWRPLATQYAGYKPIIVGVSNARAFGGNDLRNNVHGHYVTIVGKTARGDYIVSDPNSAEGVAGKFNVYTDAQFAAAQPFWAAIPNGTPVQGQTQSFNISNPLDVIGQLKDAIAGLINIFGGLKSWIDNPMRLVKIGIGSLLIVAVVVGLFFDSAFNVIVKVMGPAGKVATGAKLGGGATLAPEAAAAAAA